MARAFAGMDEVGTSVPSNLECAGPRRARSPGGRFI